MHSLSDFDFDLPKELIAQHPASERTASRLLCVGEPNRDLGFIEFLDLVNPGDVLVFNNSKVIPARIFGVKATGGRVEILVERILGEHEALVLLRVSKKPEPGAQIILDGHAGQVIVLGRDTDHQDRFRLRFVEPVLSVLQVCGEVPLPPYIEHKPTASDTDRYQTVYAESPGSVAAPTAGLHFDRDMLNALKAKGVHCAYVTLHVGTGTFAPVRTDDIGQHRMHSEWCEVPQATADLIAQARQHNKRVIAVGTTSLRTLESSAVDSPPFMGLVAPGSRETDIFIRPGYQFKVVDSLLTNFHLPKSTLLMLVAAFIGYDKMREVYAHAIASRYRFFSYGDAMFCPRHL